MSNVYIIASMLREVITFLQTHCDGCRPLLLGYSGGPDSKALLYALLEAGVRQLHIAHVDHGWRPESSREAAEIEKEVSKLCLPFHTMRLCFPAKRNQEAIAREERFSFFCSLFETISFQALLLAHHADDQAETVLKRLLEGAHLPFLGGMEPISQRGKMVIWRPLLTVRRSTILSFLKSKQLQPLMDPSNENQAYLRARMRSRILPALAHDFGKEIFSNLLLLSRRASEFKEYLDRKMQRHPIHQGPFGWYSCIESMERVEARHFVQMYAQKEKLQLSRNELELLLDAAASKRTHRQIGVHFFVDRGFVFFLAHLKPLWDKIPLVIQPGTWQSGFWRIEISEITNGAQVQAPYWTEVWSGHFSVYTSGGMLTLPQQGMHLRSLWNKKKVPAFLRYQMPIVVDNGKVISDLLSGQRFPFRSLFKLDFSVSSHS